MMHVNLANSTTSSEQEQKMVYMLAIEMAEEYKFPKTKIQEFVMGHEQAFSTWISETYNTKVTPFRFEGVAFGFTFHDDEFVTLQLLKTPAGKISLR